MDRGLGQCVSYAEKYGAVLFFIVYNATACLIQSLRAGLSVYVTAIWVS